MHWIEIVHPAEAEGELTELYRAMATQHGTAQRNLDEQVTVGYFNARPISVPTLLLARHAPGRREQLRVAAHQPADALEEGGGAEEGLKPCRLAVTHLLQPPPPQTLQRR